MLNIQTQHNFKYAHQQILFFKLLFNVNLDSIQVIGPWLWGNRSFFLQWWGRGRGPVGKMPHQSMVLKNALPKTCRTSRSTPDTVDVHMLQELPLTSSRVR